MHSFIHSFIHTYTCPGGPVVSPGTNFLQKSSDLARISTRYKACLKTFIFRQALCVLYLSDYTFFVNFISLFFISNLIIIYRTFL